jgi:glycogen debranching enzyme
MKPTHKSASAILWYESAGFLMLFFLAWMDGFHSSWRESAIESVAVLAVWIVVFTFTKRLVTHLHHLEGFLRVCAWCQRIYHEDQWLSLEQYFSKGFKTETTHGICPRCAVRAKKELAQDRQNGGKKGEPIADGFDI